jgi:hypothetical protein
MKIPSATGHHLPDEDLDWLGVHATRLNAHLFRTIFRDLAHPVILKEYSFVQKPAGLSLLLPGGNLAGPQITWLCF